MKIEYIEITKDSPVFIIAELSVNHNGSLETAIETVKAAKRAGSDCIKLQTYTADTMTIASDKDDLKNTIWHNTIIKMMKHKPITQKQITWKLN